MKRYHSGAPPFDPIVLPQIKQVYDRLIAVTEPWIWSEHNAGAGLNTLARKHGDFDNEKMTLDSVVHLIAQGGS